MRVDLSKLNKVLISQLYKVFRIIPSKGGDPAAGSPTAPLLRLHPNHLSHQRLLSPRTFTSPALGVTNSHGVTGVVYKARERIHRGMLIRDY